MNPRLSLLFASALVLIPIAAMSSELRSLDAAPLLSLSGRDVVRNRLLVQHSNVTLLTVVDDYPRECTSGYHSLTPMFPGAVCMRDGAKWAEVMNIVSQSCAHGHCGADGNALVEAIFDLAMNHRASRGRQPGAR